MSPLSMALIAPGVSRIDIGERGREKVNWRNKGKGTAIDVEIEIEITESDFRRRIRWRLKLKRSRRGAQDNHILHSFFFLFCLKMDWNPETQKTPTFPSQV